VRTLIVALAIAVGVFAVGVVLNTREILVREYRRDQASALVSSAIVYIAPFQEDLADSIARLPMVAAAEGRTLIQGRVYRGTSLPQDLVLIAVPDFANMRVDAITPLAGAYPPGRGEVVLERRSFEDLGTQIGQELSVELSNDATRTLKVVGGVHDPEQFAPALSGVAVGYVTLETLQGLGYLETYSELRVRVTEPAHDERRILAALSQVEDRLKESGRTIVSRKVITRTVADPFIDSIVLILTGFGLVILVLSGFLVINAISALITQQIPQIGVMKLIGARRWQIMRLYLATVLIYGLLAVVVALPLAALTARLLMTNMVEKLLNVMPLSYNIPVPLLVIQAAVGLLLPLGAGLAPVIRGTGVTTQRALSDIGLGGGVNGHSLFERGLVRLQKARAIQRPLLLAIRNTLRHKGRLAQTLVVLIFGTALFVSVLSVRASVTATLASFMRFHRYDVSVEMKQPELVTRLEQAAREAPGVVDVEIWSSDRATRVRPDDSKSNVFNVVAVPAGTTFMDPELVAGRWLPAGLASAGPEASAARASARALAPAPGAQPNPVVVNSDLVDDERDLHVGSDLVLDISGHKAAWHVVGIVSTESRGPAVYVSRDDFAYATRAPGQGTYVQVRTARHDPASQHLMAARLYDHFKALGLKVNGAETAEVIQQQNVLLFTVVVTFLILMALLLAAVGGLGLATTMSINMMERVREVGILRAIGASNVSVRQIVLAEGIAMAVISWAVGTAFSFFTSPIFSRELGLALIKIPLRYKYSFAAAGIWFFILLAIAVAASLGPARAAVRLTVREVLAYE
jgi:putative ABC transport system permease protein